MSNTADMFMRDTGVSLPYSKMTEAKPLTQDHKNVLEEYMYGTRGKLHDRDASYMQPTEKGGSGPSRRMAEDVEGALGLVLTVRSC